MTHFARHDGVGPTVLLRAPFGDFALDREVVVKLCDLPSNRGEHIMQIEWQAAGGGSYPIFIGSLACLPHSAANARIELEGTFTIPGGLVGKALDVVIGHRIAVAAAHSLLQALRNVVEAACDGDVLLRAQMTAKPCPPTYE